MILIPLSVRHIFFLLCFIFGLDSILNAQSHSCSFDSDYASDFGSNSSFRSSDELYEEAYQEFIRSGAYENYRDSTFLDLPIVFHIVHQGDSLGSVANPRDDTIREVIDLTNAYFRQTNTNSEFLNPNYGADTQISFCLASRDEHGNSTSGIIRHYNSPDSPLLIQNKLWNKSLYVNVILIARSTCGSYSPSLDVIYIWNKCFQNSSNLTHELGHYLSLKHTFNGENICDNFDCLSTGDYVCDTPPQLSSIPVTQDGYVDMPCLFPGNSCKTDGDDESGYNPYRSMDLGGIGDQPDANNNIMGYAGLCKTDFSIGQKHRMKFNLLVQRSSIWNQASHCENPFVSYNDAGIDRIETESLDECNDFVDIRFWLLNLGQFDLSSAHIYLYRDDLLIDSLLWEGSIAPGKSIQLIFESIDLLLGENKLRIESKLPNGSLDDNPNTDDYYFTFFHNIANFSLLGEDYILYGDEDSLWIGIDTINSTEELNYFWRRNNGPIDSNQQNQPRIFISDPDTYYLHLFGDKYTCELGIFEFGVKQNEIYYAKPRVINNHGQITCGSPFARLSCIHTGSSDNVIWEARPGLINENFLWLSDDLITDVAGDYRVKV